MAISMNSFWKKSEEVLKKELETAKEKLEDMKQDLEPEPEQWVWVDGYKGTDADMRCRDVQYEIGKRYDMPEDAEIKECESGYHMCVYLTDVFQHYDINHNNRFFKVRALVRASELAEYDTSHRFTYGTGYIRSNFLFADEKRTKLTSKSIEFVSELTTDEIMDHTIASSWSAEDKELVREVGIHQASRIIRSKELTALGYSETFALYLIEHNYYEIAKIVGSQPGLSMDMGVTYGF